jgi:uncharacterized protein (TIGR02588 family)
MNKPPRKNWLEWTVFAAGLLLLLATTGYLGYQALMYGDRPAELTVSLGEPWASDPDFPARVVVPVTVHNEGGHTAAEVTVEISLLRGGDEPIERRQLTFAFVPHMSSRAGALTFEHRPDRDELRAEVLGYLEP